MIDLDPHFNNDIPSRISNVKTLASIIMSSSIRVALDWTPNTIHSGLFIAKAKNFYSDAGLDVHLLPPDTSYSTTPARRLEAGEVDLAICPSESCIAHAEGGKMKLQAIYAILQKDASAIVSIGDSFAKMKDLQGGKYGSYNARYEDHIVRAMVAADDGDGSKVTIEGNKGKLSLFEELKAGNVDATWIFLPWEGVEARQEGIKLNVFRTEDFSVPYGYSPVIAYNAAKSKVSDEVLQKFVQATRKGYEAALGDPHIAVESLKDHCVPARSKEFLLESQQDINKYYEDHDTLGSMEGSKWKTWVDWLKKQNLVAKQDMVAEDLFTVKYHS